MHIDVYEFACSCIELIECKITVIHVLHYDVHDIIRVKEEKSRTLDDKRYSSVVQHVLAEWTVVIII